MTKEERTEYMLYAVLWLLALALPPVLTLFRSVAGTEIFNWKVIYSLWYAELPFFVLFLVHDLLVARYFYVKGQRWFYCLVTILLLVAFTLLLPYFSAAVPHQQHIVMMPFGPDVTMPFLPDPSVFPPRHSAPLSPAFLKVTAAVLMIMANIGAKTYFRSVADEQRLELLESENMVHQLAYLRYQISPHFFMNTLNNIHALVDIDPEQAKYSLVELSRLMRYVLYEGEKPTIPLEKEAEFLSHYISLMKIRYSDAVHIDLALPEDFCGAEVPPLMFATFVENAFKHGVSYEKDSFISVKLEVDEERIIFRCTNSRHGDNPDGIKGIGLINVRKRLDLLYGSNYMMHVGTESDIYEILVIIPKNIDDTLSGN
ncbi:MAG: histidine kinase [Bacteroidota bacterium]|nr:histidine kinase [Bacteroidota bacterium]